MLEGLTTVSRHRYLRFGTLLEILPRLLNLLTAVDAKNVEGSGFGKRILVFPKLSELLALDAGRRFS